MKTKTVGFWVLGWLLLSACGLSPTAWLRARLLPSPTAAPLATPTRAAPVLPATPRAAPASSPAAAAATPARQPGPPTALPTPDVAAFFAPADPLREGLWEDTSSAFLLFYDRQTWRLTEGRLRHKQRDCLLRFAPPTSYFDAVWGGPITVRGYPFRAILVPYDADLWQVVMLGPLVDYDALDLRSGGILTEYFIVELLTPAEDFAPCLRDALAVMETFRLRPAFAQEHCRLLAATPWRAGERVTLPQQVEVFREPRWLDTTWQGRWPAGTEVDLVAGPLCAVVPQGLDVAWAGRVVGTAEVGWFFQHDTRGDANPPPTRLTSQVDIPLPRQVCPDAPATLFGVGDEGQVCTQRDALRLRSGPGYDAPMRARLLPGTRFTIVGGPTCADGWVWWEVRTEDGERGWIVEGSDEVDPAYICPVRQP